MGHYNVDKIFVLQWRKKDSIGGYSFSYKSVFTVNVVIDLFEKDFHYYIKPLGSLEATTLELYQSETFSIKRFVGKNDKETIGNIKKFVARVCMSKIRRIKEMI